MKRIPSLILLGALAGLVVGCGRPVETREQLAEAMAGAAFPATAAKGGGAAMSLHQSGADVPEQLPKPSITVEGPHGGSAVLSVNPVGLVIGLAGQGIIFDLEYKKFSVDGLNYLKGDVSVLANFEYLAQATDPAELNFEVGLVGGMGLSGALSDELEMNIRVKTNLADLVERKEEMVLRLKGWVETRDVRFDFADEDLVINWRELEERANQR